MPAAVLAVVTLGTAAVPSGAATTSAAAPPEETASAVAGVVQTAMADGHLRAVIVEVTQGGEVVARQAFGTSMDGVPATTDMHFRNGAVAFTYLGTLLMQFVDEHEVGLDDTIDRWMPDLPEADEVTLRMLANQTSGYPDYETDPAWEAAWSADPFHIWTFEERLAYAFSRPAVFAPGTNWSYAHTNFMILGEVLARIGGKPLDQLLQEKVLDPMGLTDTVASVTSDVPDPVLHTFSSERRAALGIPPATAFYEESTFWNTQWGTPMGANETTTIDDLATTAAQVGTGALLSEGSYHAMTDPDLLGFGHSDPSCAPSCFTQVEGYNFGLGVVRSGSWILQDPLLAGISGTTAYLPSQQIAIAVAVTYLPGAFDAEGNYPNAADHLFRLIGAVVAPGEAPPMPPG
ncbi:serine hydrolase domain-containing protein [Modestobacter excelsi]|uniref:serine hydrolase domain-containing protein n=1 Tax=Modestobacter excelsi TaxID=2213161 RepID=UPI00110C97C8|nr:serine hydrolase domain-containing protein [Modestobacter excelsi]